MKNSIRITIWSVVALVLVALLVILLVKPSLLPTPHINLPGIARLTYDDAARYTAGSGSARDITAVDIEWLDGAVEIVPCEGTETSFEESGTAALDEEESLRWYNENGTLHIRYAKVGTALTGNLNKVLTLRLPKDAAYTRIDVETVSGEITVGQLSADEMGLETVSGTISLAGLTGRELDLSTVSGGMDAKALRLTEIDAETTSGAMNLVCSDTPRRMDIDSVSGDVQVTLPADTGFTADFSTVSGDFSSTIPAMTHDGKYIAGDGSMELECQSVSGGLWIIAD